MLDISYGIPTKYDDDEFIDVADTALRGVEACDNMSIIDLVPWGACPQPSHRHSILSLSLLMTIFVMTDRMYTLLCSPTYPELDPWILVEEEGGRLEDTSFTDARHAVRVAHGTTRQSLFFAVL